MSNPLREAIITQLKGANKTVNATGNPTLDVDEIIYGERADAILDAVIASLPSDDYEPDEYSRGIRDVRELLQSAKSTSREQSDE